MPQAKISAIKSLLDTMKGMFRDMSPGHAKEELGRNIAAMETQLAKADDWRE